MTMAVQMYPKLVIFDKSSRNYLYLPLPTRSRSINLHICLYCFTAQLLSGASEKEKTLVELKKPVRFGLISSATAAVAYRNG